MLPYASAAKGQLTLSSLITPCKQIWLLTLRFHYMLSLTNCISRLKPSFSKAKLETHDIFNCLQKITIPLRIELKTRKGFLLTEFMFIFHGLFSFVFQ